MREDVRNRIEMLDSIVASLKDYPNFGGDIGVMKEVERLRREAKIEALEWVNSIEPALADILHEEIVRLRNEGEL